MEVFKLALDNNDLIDTRWKNQKFTWSNHHSNDTYTMERLDRVVATKRWLEEFGNTSVEMLVASNLDHCSLFVPYK